MSVRHPHRLTDAIEGLVCDLVGTSVSPGEPVVELVGVRDQVGTAPGAPTAQGVLFTSSRSSPAPRSSRSLVRFPRAARSLSRRRHRVARWRWSGPDDPVLTGRDRYSASSRLGPSKESADGLCGRSVPLLEGVGVDPEGDGRVPVPKPAGHRDDIGPGPDPLGGREVAKGVEVGPDPSH
jgi:hypothetical protein